MEEAKFKELIKQYLKDNLTINAKEKGGDYGSKKYIEISLELDGEVISTSYIDE